jgi:hypothetical protein
MDLVSVFCRLLTSFPSSKTKHLIPERGGGQRGWELHGGTHGPIIGSSSGLPIRPDLGHPNLWWVQGKAQALGWKMEPEGFSWLLFSCPCVGCEVWRDRKHWFFSCWPVVSWAQLLWFMPDGAGLVAWHPALSLCPNRLRAHRSDHREFQVSGPSTQLENFSDRFS